MFNFFKRVFYKNKDNQEGIVKNSVKLPVEVGDIIVLKSGVRYKVGCTSCVGLVNEIRYSLSEINNSGVYLHDKEIMWFKSLRELNWTIEQQIDSIREIIQGRLKRTPIKNEKSIDELHKEALKFNKQRDKIKNMMNELEVK